MRNRSEREQKPFDQAYYRRFYVNRRTRVISAAEAQARAQWVACFVQQMESNVDVSLFLFVPDPLCPTTVTPAILILELAYHRDNANRSESRHILLVPLPLLGEPMCEG